MIGTQSALKWTYKDYLSFSDEKRYEIIEGEKSILPSLNTYHQKIFRRLGEKISGFVYSNDLGEVFYAPYDVVLSDEDVVQPDILYVSRERLDIITEKNIQGSPDLIIEIISGYSEKQDRIEKKKAYSKHGVKEYWIVDPASQSIEVMILGELGYTTIGIYGKDENLTSSVLKGMDVNLKEVF